MDSIRFDSIYAKKDNVENGTTKNLSENVEIIIGLTLVSALVTGGSGVLMHA